MQAGDYLLVDGISVRIKRTSDRFVVLETGAQLTHDQAGKYKCSAEGRFVACEKARQIGKTETARQLGLI